ncbi:MAG: TetR/AcrR family transcriptional regulator [Pseudomonadales bacterium]|nr:TetR/AcrR family transcriptional regulator [Pseudomonadales bacterium]MDG1441639.1 TetR/AcrR family transcriptional regulator [Pseudomonadales bacterium]
MKTAGTKTAFSKEGQREQKRLAVLQIGARLFSERGFDRTSLDDIATELKVSKRTLYYYISSKDEILFECSQLAFQYLNTAMQDAEHANVERPPLDRLEAFFRLNAQVLSNDFGACLVRCQNDVLSQESRAVLHEGYKKVDFAIRQLLKEGVEEGSIKPCDPKFTAAAIFGAFNWLPYWHRDGRKGSYSEIAEQFLTTLVDGLGQRN